MGGKRSTSTSQVSIPPEVLARYNAVNTRAEDVASNPFKQYGTTADAFVAPINEQQTAGIANVNASAGLAQPYINAATGATAAGMGAVNPGELDINKYMSPYIQNVADTTGAMMAQANEQAMSGGLGTAIMSGAFGGDRAGIAAANLNQQQGLAYGKTMADIYQQGYGQAVETAGQQQGVALGAEQANKARLLTGAGQIANLGTTAQTAGLQGAEAQINAGTLEQQTEQAGKTALVNQFMQEQGYPFQVAQFLANIAMGTGSLSGSTTTSTQPAPFFSDRRLKEDVKRIGKTDDGLPIYKFKYKGDDTHQTHVGFMADEVEQKKPEAVGLHPSGYKTVDYDKATRSSMGGGVMSERAGQGFAEGGVAGPYGSSAGSQVDFGGYVPQAYLPVGDLMMADPALMDTSNKNLAALMERSANFGTNLQKLDEQFGKEGSFWDMFKKQDEYASGGAAYLRTPSGGLVPNSAKTYLSDTLESQSKGDKPELKTADAGGNSGKSPAENIADLGKMAMMFLGMNSGGRVGYQDGGTETEEQRLRRLLRSDIPEAQTLGSLPDATVRPSVILPKPEEQQFPDGGLVPAIPTPPVQRPSVVLPNPAEQQFPDGGLVPAIPTPPADRLATSPRPVPRPENLIPPPRADDEVVGLARAAIDRASPPPAADQTTGGLAAADVTAPQAAVVPAASTTPPPGLAGAKTTGGWEEFAPRVKQRESGGDYDALYGFSNREGGPFEGKNVTEMTIDEALEFANPSGAYGQYVARTRPDKEHGVATPLGAYQIVGRTLRGIKEGMGLTGDELMTPELQDQMAKWLYDNYGEDQWAASAGNGPAGAGGYSGGLSRSTSGGDGRGLGFREFVRENAGNKDFLLSLLSGLGTMASSPSLYLGSAVLQGVGGAANTYMAREQQRGEITKQNIENMYQIGQKTMDWNAMNPDNQITPAEMARIVGMEMNIPETATAQDIMSGAYTPTTGGNLDRLDYQTFQNGVVDIGGRTVPMQNDPASLLRFINDNGFAAPDSALGRQVAIAEARLAEINASGRIYDKNGDLVVDPRTAAAADEQAQNDANRAATAAFREQGNARLPQIPVEIDNTLKQASVFSQLEAGALTQESTALAAMAEALGMPVPEGVVADRALVEQAIKFAAQREIARAESLGATEAQLSVLGNVSANSNLQPEAVKAIITAQLAHSLREKDFYEMRDEWARSEAANGRPMDQSAYVEWFNRNKPYEDYYDEAKKSLPLFAGEPGSRQKPHPAGSSADIVGIGQYFLLPDGSIGQRTE